MVCFGFLSYAILVLLILAFFAILTEHKFGRLEFLINYSFSFIIVGLKIYGSVESQREVVIGSRRQGYELLGVQCPLETRSIKQCIDSCC